MERTDGAPGSVALVTLALSVVIGGANLIAVRFSNRELEPFWGAGLRFSLAAVLFVLIAAGSRLARPRGRERLAVRGVAGALLAVVGIGWMTFGPESASIPLGPLVAMLVAALVIGQSIILGKRLSGNHPVMTNAVGMSAGALMLLAFSAVAGEPWVLPRDPARWSVLYLVTVGSVGLFGLVMVGVWFGALSPAARVVRTPRPEAVPPATAEV